MLSKSYEHLDRAWTLGLVKNDVENWSKYVFLYAILITAVQSYCAPRNSRSNFLLKSIPQTVFYFCRVVQAKFN